MAARGELSVTPVPGSIIRSELVPGGGLDDADIVVDPVGNTFDLLRLLRSHGLPDSPRGFLATGGKVHTGSAGVVIVGADIGLADVDCDGIDENRFGMKDT